VLDVHPPHESVHGWRDFFVHLITITVGLLIALSLEGCVEWRHHRHLVHEAEVSLHEEIKANSENIATALKSLHKQQDLLQHDVSVLNYFIKNKKLPENSSLEISYGVHHLRDVSWKTAQTTAVLSYMSYKQAQEYADIYSTQENLNLADQQAVRDTIISLAPFASSEKGDADPTGGQAVEARNKIDILQGQLMLVDALMKSLDSEYKKFLAAHPE
jgi:hypothetical protein